MEKKYVCKFCNKECPSGKSLGGHIRIHTNEYSVHSDTYNAQRRFFCRECGKGFGSLKSLCTHMDCHNQIVMVNQSDSENSLSPSRKRSKKVMKQSNSESFTNGSLSSSASEIDQDDKNGALSLMIMSRESSSFKKGHNLVVNSLAESSDNNSVIVETKSSSGDELKMLKDDKVRVDDQLRSVDDYNGVSSCDSDGSDSDYFMNGPKKSESDISVDGSLRNSGFKKFRNSDEFGVKKGGSMYELMSKSKRVLHFHENDSCDRYSERKSPMVKKASGTKKKSNGHECPFCDRVFKSGQALGGHKRSHSIGNQEHKVAEKRNLFDLNIPAPDSDE